jgi:hypothetical protein
LFENFLSLDTAVEIDGAPGTGAFTEGAPVLPHFITGPPGQLKGRALLFLVAVEDIPTGGQHHEVAEAGQGKAPLVNQAVDLVDLGDVEIGIEPVVGVLLPQGFDEPFFFVLPDAFLRQIDQPGDLVDQKEFSAVAFTPDIFAFSSGHSSFYNKGGINTLT